jgi:hypothetical protein
MPTQINTAPVPEVVQLTDGTIHEPSTYVTDPVKLLGMTIPAQADETYDLALGIAGRTEVVDDSQTRRIVKTVNIRKIL